MIKQRMNEREALVQDFIQAMNNWLTAFNDFMDRHEGVECPHPNATNGLCPDCLAEGDDLNHTSKLELINSTELKRRD